MKSPLVVGLASIVPGMGLLIVGKHKHAIVSAALFSGTMFVFLLSTGEVLRTLSYFAVILIWFMQGSYAIAEARVAGAIAAGEAERARKGKPIPSAPSNLNHIEKELFKAGEIIKQQLKQGEAVKVAVPAFSVSLLRGTSASSHIGLLKKGLIIVSNDFWGKPASVRRFPADRKGKVKFKTGLLQDRLEFAVEGKKPIKLQVPRSFRSYSEKIVRGMGGSVQ